ncbi:PIG-L family deacetylase [Reichenbachiella agarivorans]|uniref:PIG-L family deacetylase n=1 Tax=Reichenbachiella agarivorans TaxID=2979464 RepID=A0ABY6CPT6_9BACT|nr:PIG-L family deacetylase [Reichenbachiella agarivorans]UXP31799.1 PIG-L family deacetylase [Reichenbachiella agarivorans]
MNFTRLSFVILVSFLPFFSYSQKPQQANSAEILHKLEQLNVLGSVLYVAAHPDDENTRLITYLANEKHYNTAYLSATRGDGGQNLVGSEIRESLGVIRTQELLAARRIDGGQQYFSRANDFGYSKKPEETFNIWNREEVLSDFVRVYRKHKPDVIVTRFPEDGRGGHGHHTASAILAREAFALAADPTAFPESADKYGVWQAKRLVFNTHPYFFRDENGVFDPTGLLAIDLGGYNPLLGQSYTEIAAESRSCHKSQGFGTTGSRGESMEYLIPVLGDTSTTELFNEITTTWARIKGGHKVGYHVDKALMNYDPTQPEIIIPDLIKAYNELQKIDNPYWKELKQHEIKELIKECAGLYMEAKTDAEVYVPGDSIKLSIEAINRSQLEVSLSAIDVVGIQTFKVGQRLYDNRPLNMDKNYQLKEGMDYSQPYWLKDKGTLGMYRVDDVNLIGKPENDPALQSVFTIQIGETYLDYKLPIVYKRNDPVEGEVYDPVVIAPPVFTNIQDKVLVFANGAEKEVSIKVISGRDGLQGELTLDLPEGWKSKPKAHKFSLDAKGQEAVYKFLLTPPSQQSEGEITAVATVEGKGYSYQLETISYDHIPKQTLLPTATAKVVKIDLKKKGQKIAYIEGAGDDIPASLRQIGYQVDVVNDQSISVDLLTKYDAVILGIRAFNTRNNLKFENKDLMTYVKNGGTVIVQYNTSHRLVTEEIAPYPLKLSRDRVSVEEAEIRVLIPSHPVLNTPNQISAADFDNWTQERGLYFPNEWDDKFDAVLSSNDPGEDPRNGGLLVAKYGKGYYIYTGYSWFRQLPAGVPGAYRIYTNLISIGK